MMRIPLVEIGKCCDIVNGSTPSRIKSEYWNGDIDWFTPKDLSGLESKYVGESPEKITDKGYKSCSTKIVPTRSLLYTSRAPIGHIAINTKEVCTNQGFKTLVPREGVNIEYLYYALKKFTPNLKNLGNGATFKELSKATISKFKIPLPPLDQQEKIANILDMADAYRQKTKALIEKYDELTQSLFLEMFGDPVTNPKGWKTKMLQEVSNLTTKGSSPKWQGYAYISEGVRFVTSENVRLGYLDISKDKFVAEEFHHKLKRSQLKVNDLLLNLVGASIGRGALVTKEVLPANINQAVAKTELNFSFVNPVFILKQIITPQIQDRLIGNKVEGARANISLKNVRELRIYIPPLKLQNQFAQRVLAIEAQKAVAQQEFDKSKELFNSLLQNAFKGELV